MLFRSKALTTNEIAELIQKDRYAISAVVSRLHRPGKRYPQRIYISAWVHDHHGERRYPRAMYSLGALEDKKKPRVDKKKIRREYDKRVRLKFTANSVFNLGKTRNEYMEVAKCLAKDSARQ